MMDTCTFVCIPRMYREWAVNYGLRVVRMSRKFINGNKCTVLAREVDNRGGYACVGEERYETSLHLPLNFAENLKLL